jgi:hypothetical protein
MLLRVFESLHGAKRKKNTDIPLFNLIITNVSNEKDHITPQIMLFCFV